MGAKKDQAIDQTETPSAVSLKVKRSFSEVVVRGLGILVVLGLVGYVAYAWIALHWTYASGERAGFVQKLSKKGWLCKTWEGELAMVNMPGAASEKFLFTVPDEAVANDINKQLGKRVSIEYKEPMAVPLSCFGETGYFVHAVRVLDSAHF